MASATPIRSFEAQKVTPHVQMLFPWKEESLDQSMHTQSESTSESTVAEEEVKEEDDYGETIPASTSRMVFRGAYAKDFELILDS
ncbi:hypothetical protein RSOL_168030, partial [Rhizoctonia solani AG-3 Rhs1AP]